MGALRLFLALVVVIDHYRMLCLRPTGVDVDSKYLELGMNAGYAVLFFYVISGFLMSFVLDTKYADDAAGVYQFYKARFIRIFSLYWPIMVFSFLVVGLPHVSAKHRLLDRFFAIFLIGADWRVSFGAYPETYFKLFPAFLNPAWTLGAELTFYVLAPFLLRSLSGTICVFMMSVAIRAPLVYAFGHNDSWVYHFFPSTILFFLLGNLAYRISKNVPALTRYGWVLLAVAIYYSIRGVNRPFDGKYMYATVTCFALCLPSIFAKSRNNRLLNFLGDLSFPVYLIQVFIITWGMDFIHPLIVRLAGSNQPSPYLSVGFLVLLVTLTAALVFFLVERPCSALMRVTVKWIESGLSFIAKFLARTSASPRLGARAGRFFLKVVEARPTRR
jgi:peptidoglycan/LPS O-acetylase OafA/YrhL